MAPNHKDFPAERLLQLSNEVGRIANNLAQLSTDHVPMTASLSGQVSEISADAIGAVIRRRRQRALYFPKDMLADPVWDMMLDLLQAEVMQRRMSVSDACIAAGVPATTALRWLKTMERQGLVVRRPDPRDGRRIFVALCPEASLALRKWFASNFSEAA